MNTTANSRIHWGQTTSAFKLDDILLALRNDLVHFWAQLVQANPRYSMIEGYHQYCMTLDNLDPDNPHRHDRIENAISDYRNAVLVLAEAVTKSAGDQGA